MTPEEYRKRIFAAELSYDNEIRRITCRRGGAIAANPGLVYYTPEAQAAARVRDQQIDDVEREWYSQE